MSDSDHDDDDTPDSDAFGGTPLEGPVGDMIAERVSEMRPHKDDPGIGVVIPAFAVHVEMCGGMVTIECNETIGAQIRDGIDLQLQQTAANRRGDPQAPIPLEVLGSTKPPTGGGTVH